MKKTVFYLMYALMLCGGFASCSNDDDEGTADGDKEVEYYDYSEKGFFMNGDVKVCGFFAADSVMEGYTKYVKRSAHYRTVDGEEGDFVYGYGLVVNIDNFARFYSDDISYNADSTSIDCQGEIMMKAYDNKPYEATITADIDSIGKPHLVTCRSVVDGKKVVMQFRQTFTLSIYSDCEVPDTEGFTI